MKAHQKRENEAIQLKVQRTIGKQLCLGFDDVLTEALPPHFEDLLRRFEERSNCADATRQGTRDGAAEDRGSRADRSLNYRRHRFSQKR